MKTYSYLFKSFVLVSFIAVSVFSIFGQAGNDSEIVRLGLLAWRAPREIGSCNTCHAPDAFDLAAFNFSDEDLRRRGIGDGMSTSEADALVNYVKYVRRKHNIKKLLDPATARPFQPGGKVLEGNTTAERDIAFGRMLKTKLPTLMGSAIDSEEKAILAARELLAINLRGLPIGLEYPRWSEDHFHHANRGTMNEWIPDVARLPLAGKEAEWIALQDNYLADPSEKNFWAMYDGVATLTAPQFNLTSAGNNFERDRFRSQMIAQHLLREQYLGTTTSIVRGHIAFSYRSDGIVITGGSKDRLRLPNPWWEVGDFARVMLENGNINARTNLLNLGYPDRIASRIDPVLTGQTLQNSIRMPWFWLGFTLDPGLRRINGSNSTRVGEYLTANLYENAMFVHNDFMSIVRLVSAAFDPEGDLESRNSKGELIQFYDSHFSYTVGYGRAILRQGNFINANGTTRLNPEHIELHKTLMGNSFRMSLYLVRAQLQRRGGTFAALTVPIAQMQEFFNFFEPNNTAQNNALLNEVSTMLTTAKTSVTSDEALFAAINEPLIGTNANVSAANYRPEGLAADAIASAFGLNLAVGMHITEELPLPKTLGGTTVKIKDNNGVEKIAPLFFVSPTQINYQIPADVAAGMATITIISGDGITTQQRINIHTTAPGVFTADATGQGFAAGVATRVKANGDQINEPLTSFNQTQNKIVAMPLDLGADQGAMTDKVFLILFGTGIRKQSSVTATIGGANAEVWYAGKQGFYEGLDQINVLIPRSVIGKGEVDVVLTVDGKAANSVKVSIK